MEKEKIITETLEKLAKFVEKWEALKERHKDLETAGELCDRLYESNPAFYEEEEKALALQGMQQVENEAACRAEASAAVAPLEGFGFKMVKSQGIYAYTPDRLYAEALEWVEQQKKPGGEVRILG